MSESHGLKRKTLDNFFKPKKQPKTARPAAVVSSVKKDSEEEPAGQTDQQDSAVSNAPTL
ncbi:hypothetical protein FBU59_004798, partial [Linderina macrospora]